MSAELSETAYQLLSLDFPAVTAAVCAGVSCALLGNFLLLRRMSLMGDAISHAVLPGIVIAFLISGTRASIPIFIGAALAGILTAVLVELVKTHGRLDSGASMGVVFSVLFALGVLIMEQAAAQNVDLDADCLLHGQLETIFWYPARELAQLLRPETFWALPTEVLASLTMCGLTLLFVIFFFKELKISSFDAQLANTLGYNATALHMVLMVFVAGAVVVSFKIVGSILVIAMLICPPAAARLLTDKLRTQVLLSVLFAAFGTLLGYVLAAFAPQLFGISHSLSASGMITVVAGLILFTSVLFAPEYGVLARAIRRARLTTTVAREDVLGVLYRFSEAGMQSVDRGEVLDALRSSARVESGVSEAKRRGELEVAGGKLSLTEAGAARAKSVVRTHRLWESYLVHRLGLREDHVHDTAMELEHFTDDSLQQRLAEREEFPEKDPHGREIPPD